MRTDYLFLQKFLTFLIIIKKKKILYHLFHKEISKFIIYKFILWNINFTKFIFFFINCIKRYHIRNSRVFFSLSKNSSNDHVSTLITFNIPNYFHWKQANLHKFQSINYQPDYFSKHWVNWVKMAVGVSSTCSLTVISTA